MNAFFSGSVKVFSTIPFFFPANIHKSNGTDFNPQGDTSKVDFYSLEYFMKGYVEKREYEKYLKEKWFGVNVPDKFDNYNSQLGIEFPFWSSAAITEVYCITSLSKYLRLSSSIDH